MTLGEWLHVEPLDAPKIKSLVLLERIAMVTDYDGSQQLIFYAQKWDVKLPEADSAGMLRIPTSDYDASRFQNVCIIDSAITRITMGVDRIGSEYIFKYRY